MLHQRPFLDSFWIGGRAATAGPSRSCSRDVPLPRPLPRAVPQLVAREIRRDAVQPCIDSRIASIPIEGLVRPQQCFLTDVRSILPVSEKPERHIVKSFAVASCNDVKGAGIAVAGLLNQFLVGGRARFSEENHFALAELRT